MAELLRFNEFYCFLFFSFFNSDMTCFFYRLFYRSDGLDTLANIWKFCRIYSGEKPHMAKWYQIQKNGEFSRFEMKLLSNHVSRRF